MSKIRLSRSDIVKLNKVMNSLPDNVEFFELERQEHGIGYSLDVIFKHSINDLPCEMRVGVIGTEDW